MFLAYCHGMKSFIPMPVINMLFDVFCVLACVAVLIFISIAITCIVVCWKSDDPRQAIKNCWFWRFVST